MYKYINLRIDLLLYVFILVALLLRMLSNINAFNYSFAVIFPVLIIPFGFIYLIPKIGKIDDFKLNLNIFLFFIIILFLIAIPVLQNLFFQNLIDISGRYSHDFIWVISLLALSWMISGGIIGSFKSFDIVIKVLNAIFFVIFLVILIYSLNGGIFIDYNFLSNLRSDGIKIHHLSLTEPLMLVFYMLIAQVYNAKYKWFVILGILFLMLALGGRVAFFCYILSILIYEFLISNKINYLLKISLISLISIYFILSLSLSLSLEDDFAFNKLFLSDGLENDASFQGRMQFFYDFKEGFLEQVIIGNPNFFIIRHNDLGTYAHNILSLFQFYGLIPFIIILFSLLFIVNKIYILRLYSSDDVLIKFGILFFIYTFFSVLIGKAVLFSSLWFILGFWFFKLRNIQVLKNVRS